MYARNCLDLAPYYLGPSFTFCMKSVLGTGIFNADGTFDVVVLFAWLKICI